MNKERSWRFSRPRTHGWVLGHMIWKHWHWIFTANIIYHSETWCSMKSNTGLEVFSILQGNWMKTKWCYNKYLGRRWMGKRRQGLDEAWWTRVYVKLTLGVCPNVRCHGDSEGAVLKLILLVCREKSYTQTRVVRMVRPKRICEIAYARYKTTDSVGRRVRHVIKEQALGRKQPTGKTEDDWENANSVEKLRRVRQSVQVEM